MKLLAPHDRPRGKLGRLGAAALGDNELLAAGLDHGSQYEGALEVANRVLDLAGGVHGLTRVLDGRLRRITGVGPATAARILAVIELGCPRDVAADLLPRYGARSSSSSASSCSIRGIAWCACRCCQSARSTRASCIRARCFGRRGRHRRVSQPPVG